MTFSAKYCGYASKNNISHDKNSELGRNFLIFDSRLDILSVLFCDSSAIRDMKIRATIIALCFCLTAVAGAATRTDSMAAIKAALPAGEVSILLDVGREYGLTGEALKLLLVIRKIENGRPGYEMGVASDFPRHTSHRHKNDPARSLRVQARWAAGTIRNHFKGDVLAFAKRYCPPKPEHWNRMARHWLDK